MLRIETILARFGADIRATSATEFALVLPILATLALGSIEMQRYQRLSRQLLVAAETIADTVAQRDTNESTLLNIDLQSMKIIFPQSVVEKGAVWWEAVNHQISHVQFKPTIAGCTKNCTYKASMIWHWPPYAAPPGFGGLKRQCGELTPSADDGQPSGANLPQATFAAGTLVIVDLRYAYTPLFGTTLFKPIILERQGFSFPRFASPYLKAPQVTWCPGYS